ncbi:hypothetical protein J437_LFUL007976 [Ladona fulva]|uniref:alpha-amylase n=1 Tax=Ladona fulva TaxID=123851 RepID=A0A8K0P0C4_LADFU|nr:hypothetical protein J437_LFUL007976 [Ladona fulva]
MNHMTGDHPNAVGIAGTRAEPRERSYPGVPYNASHFNEPCSINDYRNEQEVRNCDLVGLHDLNQSLEYVRGKLVEFLNVLISHGVVGFRVDAAKHMWPADLKHILDATADLNVSYGFPTHARPFIYQEVIDLGGEGISWNQYKNIGRITEFKFGAELGKAFRGNNALKWLRNFGKCCTDWNLMPSGDAVVFIDNHDNQRGHGAGGNQILTYKDTRLYKMAVAFMLAWPYGEPRLMSSFQFNSSEAGPPHDKRGDILPVTINEDMTCGNGWICEHRWRQIYDMTCLPAGTYCDVISGLKRDGGCTGKAIIVREDSTAHIQIAANEEDGVLAIHIDSKL